MLCKRGLPSRGVFLSVRLSVTFVNSIKTNKRICKLFSPSGSQTVLLLPVPNVMAISRRDLPPPNGGVECSWGITQFSANIWLNRVLWKVRLPSAIHSAATNRDKLLTLVAGKRRRLFLTGDDDEVFMTRSQSTLRGRQQSSNNCVQL